MKFNALRNYILLILTIILMACTTTFSPNSGMVKRFTITTKDVAGSPSQPNTEIVITKTIQNVSNLSGKAFKQAFNYMNPDLPKKNPDEALKIINTIPKEKLNNYEIALIHEYSGYAFIEKEDYTKAIEQFNLALSKRDYIPISSEISILATLARLYAAIENYNPALECIYQHADYLPTMSDAHYFYIAALQNKAGDTKNALKNITTAINLAESTNSIDLYEYELQAILYEKDNQPAKAKEVKKKIQELTMKKADKPLKTNKDNKP